MEAAKAKVEHLYPLLSHRRIVWVSRAPSAGAETGFAAGLRLFSAQPPAGWKGPPKRARSEDTEKEDTDKEDTETYNPAAHKRRRDMTDEERTQHDAKQAEEAEQAKAATKAAKAAKAASKKAEKTAPPKSAESPFAAVEVDRCFNVYTNESKLLQLGLASQRAVDASKDEFYGAFFASLRWKLEKEAEAEAEAI